MDDWSSGFQSFGGSMDLARRIRDRERLAQAGLAEPMVSARDAIRNVVSAPFQLAGAGARALKGMSSPMVEGFKQGFGMAKSKLPASGALPTFHPIPPKKPLFSYEF